MYAVPDISRLGDSKRSAWLKNTSFPMAAEVKRTVGKGLA